MMKLLTLDDFADIVFLKAVKEGGWRQTEQTGRSALVATGAFQSLRQEVFFHLFEVNPIFRQVEGGPGITAPSSPPEHVEVFFRDRLAVLGQDNSFDDIAEFADVALPRVFAEEISGTGSEISEFLLEFAIEDLQKIMCQSKDVFATAAQGGEIDLIDIEAKV